MQPQTLPLRSVAVAIIVGGLFGTAVGLWSIRSRPTSSAGVDANQIPIVEAVAAPPAAAPLAASESAPPPSPVRASTAPAPARTSKDLVQRGDVRGLLAVREGLVARGDARGIEQVDRELAEARAVRLKLDAEALRKSGSAAGAVADNPRTQ